jgi:SAM-dependent methyltransferase
MDIQLSCNTPDKELFANVATNSKLDLPWVTQHEAHDGHAVIVGGGPSLKKHIESIRKRQEHGQTVFCLNGTAEYVYKFGIRPDYLVIVDARPQNKRFIAKHWARHLYLSSQCHPSLFLDWDGLPLRNVTLWHPVIDGIDEHIASDREYAKVGGGTTVGMSAMALAYTIGYRNLHLYGYDSSHEDGSHAYSQPDGDEALEVNIFGRSFKSTLTMARQAELLPELCNTLIDLGCTITYECDGLFPWVMQNLVPMAEEEKYRRMWDLPEYRTVAPGELVADAFLKVAQPKGSVIDFGCGTGRGALKLAEAGLSVTLVDFTENSRDEAARSLPFIRWDFSEPSEPPATADYGYCTDVMEHIPPDKVDVTIQNLMRASGRVFFQISTVPDNLGALIGQPLHLTVQPHAWWADKFASLGYAVQWEQEEDTASLFYVTTHKEI